VLNEKPVATEAQATAAATAAAEEQHEQQQQPCVDYQGL
jgi:hypothetical protein